MSDSSRPSGELTREQVENWIANVGAPGPVLAFNEGAARRLGESWLRLHDRLAEIERAPRPSGEVPEAARAQAIEIVAALLEAGGSPHLTFEQEAGILLDALEIEAGWTPPGGTE